MREEVRRKLRRDECPPWYHRLNIDEVWPFSYNDQAALDSWWMAALQQAFGSMPTNLTQLAVSPSFAVDAPSNLRFEV